MAALQSAKADFASFQRRIHSLLGFRAIPSADSIMDVWDTTIPIDSRCPLSLSELHAATNPIA
jgi:hypothetical protein